MRKRNKPEWAVTGVQIGDASRAIPAGVYCWRCDLVAMSGGMGVGYPIGRPSGCPDTVESCWAEAVLGAEPAHERDEEAER